MQQPTIGSFLHFYPAGDDTLWRDRGQPLAAIIVAVWSATCVNLAVFDVNGSTYGRTSVLLVSEGAPKPSGNFAMWPAREVLPVLLDTASPLPPLPELDDAAVEQAIQTAGADVAPRVSKAHIDALMARVQYVGGRVGETTSTVVHSFLDGAFLLASGHSACVSGENFNAELGFNMAKAQAEAKARDQLWLLEGYALRCRLAGPTDAMVQRFLQWPVPAHIHPDGTPGQPGRTGTNLLDASTARDMLAHVLG